ncbi:MAG: hypothetical protein PHP82_02850 [Candidatus ainarchaeum sp.]|nr:hypothetical protein [Candidatus ainarchaeum sp.]
MPIKYDPKKRMITKKWQRTKTKQQIIPTLKPKRTEKEKKEMQKRIEELMKKLAKRNKKQHP